MKFNAKDYGIEQNTDVTAPLAELLRRISAEKGDKTLVFEKGIYLLSSAAAVKKKLFITNTIGDGEWTRGEDPHLNTIGIDMSGIKYLTVEGNGATFIIDGKMTNMAFSDCENVIVKNISFEMVNPDVHELEVLQSGLFSTVFRLDNESEYVKKHGKYYFCGTDYRVPFKHKSTFSNWIAHIKSNDKNSVSRTFHPLKGSLFLSEKKKGIFKAYYLFGKKFEKGDRFYLYDVRRKHVGIFAQRCRNIVFDGIIQRFNYSLALVCQDCENVTLKNSTFSPKPDGQKLIASLADFVQICSCRGKTEVCDNYFCGAGDDCLNIHGIHFVITKVSGRDITVKFCHPQTHGFNPLRKGDILRFVDPSTLLGKNHAKIENSVLISEKEIRLTVDRPEYAAKGYAVENVSALPDLYFAGNTLTRIITRGILVSTGGKVLIENNRFENTSMHSVLISDDAKNWYESGSVNDVEIKNNYFGKCPQYNIFVKPENTCHAGYVHHNIKITGNVFDSGKSGGLYFKSTDNVTIKGNKFNGIKRIELENSVADISD